MMPVTFGTQVAVAYNPDGAGRHLVYLEGKPGAGAADPAVLRGAELDAAIDHARAALAAMLRVAMAEGSRLVAEARVLLASLLEHRIAIAAAQLKEIDAAAVAAARASSTDARAIPIAILRRPSCPSPSRAPSAAPPSSSKRKPKLAWCTPACRKAAIGRS